MIIAAMIIAQAGISRAGEPWCQGNPGICATNVTSTAFSVSWTTYGITEEGYVLWGTAPDACDEMAFDDRGSSALSETHHVTIRNLTPNSTYYYKVVAGGEVYTAAGGAPWQQQTGSSLDPGLLPDARAIRVLQSDGETGAPGALVYVTLYDQDGAGAAGSSGVYSTVINDPDGLWIFDLTRFRTADSTAAFGYSDEDSIEFLADGQSAGYQFETTTIGLDWPDLVLDLCAGCYFFAMSECINNGENDPTAVCRSCDVTRSRAAWSISPASTVCRPAVNVCDVTDYCDGVETDCPADEFAPATTECAAADGVCDLPDYCAGTSADCLPSYVAGGTICRAAVNACDITESCPGDQPDCPADAFAPNTTECAAADGTCDLPDYCAGDSADCVISYAAAGTVCRATTNICDVAESCPGDDPACPADAFAPNTTECAAADGACDLPDYCAGDSADCLASYQPNGTLCRAAAGDCDVAESCPGDQPDCPADGFVAAGEDCDDGEACTIQDACDGGGACVGATNAGAFLQMLSPSDEKDLAGGTTIEIAWDFGDCPLTGENGVDSLRLLASLDGGDSYPIEAATDIPDAGGVYAWTVPAIDEEGFRLKLEAVDDGVVTGSAESADEFIVTMPTELTAAVDELDQAVLTWEGGPADVYIFEGTYTNDPGAWTLLAEDVESPWTDELSDPAADVYYRLANADGTALGGLIAGRTYAEFNYGYALIALPFEPAATTYAQDILDRFNGEDDIASALVRWDNSTQAWDIHYDLYPTFNNYKIELATGYFIKIETPTSTAQAGRVIQDITFAHLGYDYSLLGFPTGEWATAHELLTDLNVSGGAGSAMYDWLEETQLWSVHYFLFPDYNNFALDTAAGYFIKNDAGGVDLKFNPLDIQSETTSTSLTVSWTTSIPTTGWLVYGTDPGDLSEMAVFDWTTLFEMDTSHEVTVTDLTPGTVYYFDIVSSGSVFNHRGMHYMGVTEP